MLSSLFIQNVVLIDKLSLPFESGLTVLTGETGAGKSILLDSLSLALGERADTGLIRHGETSLSVSATFDITDNHPAIALLKEQGLDTDTTLILRRTLSKDGKSKAFINDMPVSVSFLKNIGNTLVEIHGQFATHGLLNSATHLGVLDSYGNIDTTKIQSLFTEWKNKKEALKLALDILEKAKEEEEYLRHSVRELESFNTYVGEEEDLSKRRNELMNAEKITENLNEAYSLLSGRSDTGLSSLLHQAERSVEKASRFTPSQRLSLVLEHLQKTEEELNDAVSLLEEEASYFEDPTYELEQLDGRFFALKDLARKYRVSPDELPALLTEYQEKITTLDKGEEELTLLQKQESVLRRAYLDEAHRLNDLRQKTALDLDKSVMAELPALKLSKATFKTEVSFFDEEKATLLGLNTVCFMISTNAGTPLAPLHKVASGGELARFMLALKVNLAESGMTLIFDEVDSGIGGATASAVGERLLKLSQKEQVLLVTHSPQVASFGNVHLHVDKQNESSLTTVTKLSTEQRTEEIARMLSGACVSDSARHNARELLLKSCL